VVGAKATEAHIQPVIDVAATGLWPFPMEQPHLLVLLAMEAEQKQIPQSVQLVMAIKQ
jgi:hypothetical protein